jgi:hypothetical protein
MNTPGIANGYWQVWIKTDGVTWTNLWNLQNVNNIVCGVQRPIVGIRFGGTRQRGSGESSHGIKWIDDIKIGLTEVAVDSEEADTTPPAVPTGVAIS